MREINIVRRLAILALIALTFSAPWRWTYENRRLSNGSTDGRYHTCGYVTESGVTEHLAAYWARCGRNVP